MKNFIWGVVTGIVLTIVFLANIDVGDPIDKIPVNNQSQKIYYL